MSYLEKLIRAVSTDGYDFATGSRIMPESDAKGLLSASLQAEDITPW